MTRIRRSAALQVGFDGDGVTGESFLLRTRAALSPLSLSLLAALADWRHPEELVTGEARAEIAAELLRLLDAGFVVAEGSDRADLDLRYARDWKWGAGAAGYHFGIKDPDYQGPAAVYLWLVHQVATASPVPLWTTNQGLPSVALPMPDLSAGLLATMARRRSFRGFDPGRPVPLAALRDVLFAGLGIVAFADSGVPGDGPLPLSMTPSGGARNPFEAYVVARAVEGLEPGVYHYSGVDHSLGRLPAAAPPAAALLGNQEWSNAAGAVVFLVASFERCTWKYPHPTGFRVVLLEAGHIAQNLLLAATAHELAAAPTCAIHDRAVEELFGLDRIQQAAVHAVAIGARGALPSPADLADLRPNPHLR